MMKRGLLASVLLGVLLMVGAMPAFANPEMFRATLTQFVESVPSNQLLLVSQADLKKAVDSKDEGVYIIDVRPASSYAAGHVPGSVSIPLPTVVKNESKIPTGKKIYVVCTMDTNSAFAVATLRLLGFNAWIVQGGVPGWISAGYPVAK